MRRAIETAPRDGKFVILEDDESGSFELAQWSAEAHAWVRENGELSKITPKYWHRTRRDDYLLQEGDEFNLQKQSGSSGPAASPTYLHPTRRDDFLVQEGDEFDLQKDSGSSGSSASPTYLHPTRRDDFLVQEGDEFIPQKEARSSGPSASREPRSFRFAAGRAPPQQPVAADATVALRQVAKPDAVTVARLEAQAAQDKSERRPRARRWFAVFSIAAAVVAASLIGVYFHAELVAYVTRYTGEQDHVGTGATGVEAAKQETQVPSQDSQRADSQKADSLARDPAHPQQAEGASSQAPPDSAQVKQGAEAMRPEAQPPLEKERRRAEALANELAKAQQIIATQVDQTAQRSQAAERATAELRQSLQKEHDRAEALTGELAKARREPALPSKARDQAAQRNQAAEKATASLQQSLKTEHDRAEALSSELARARRDTETQLALSSKAGDEAAQERKAAESATAELRQSLQKEHERAEALTGELAKARRDTETQLALSSKVSDEAAQVKKAAESATTELRQSLDKEHDRAEALTGELAKARRDVETQLALSSKAGDEAAQVKKAAESATAELRQSLKTEHDRAEALTGELAKAQRDLETQLALSSKAGDEAAQVKKAAESATAELRQSLQKEHDRAEALASEIATARTTIYAYEAQARKTSDQAADLKQAESATAELRQSLQKEHERAEALTSELARVQRDAETQLALASKTGDEAAQLKQLKASESASAELRLSLQKEHDRAEALASELAKAQRDTEAQLALASKAGDEAAQLKQLKASESATAELRQSLQQEHDRAEALASEMATARTTIYAYEAQARKASDQAADLKQMAESAALELRKPLEQERERAARLEQDLVAARRDNEKQIALSSKAGQEEAQVKKAAESATAELRQSLQKEHERSEALSSELAKAQRDTETQLALASKAGDEAAQVKKAAEGTTAELRLSLQKEHDRAEALSNELARAQRDTEAQVALASKAGDEAAQLKKLKEAAESATAELRLSLQQERDRVQALPPGRGPTQPTIGARTEVERASNSQVAPVTQAAEAAATAPSAAAEAQGSPEAARLLARASALIGQGDIGAARIVLERAVETGSARASFMLAETYDPLVLSTWKTYGTRGDVTKARELYAKALAGGIQEAKDRSVALH